MKTHSLKITKIFKAPKNKVFAAWANEEQMVHWMGPGTVSCSKIEMDFKVNGSYQIFMETTDGPMTAYGEYKEITPTDKISFTWGWRQNDLEGTLVTLSFKEISEGTELTLEHTNIPTEDIAESHKMGWTGIVDKLGEFLGK